MMQRTKQKRTKTKQKQGQKQKTTKQNKTTTRTNCDCLLRPRLTHKNLRHHASGLVAAKELNLVPHVGYHDTGPRVQPFQGPKPLVCTATAHCLLLLLTECFIQGSTQPANPTKCRQEKSPATEAPVTADRSPYRRFHATTYASASRRSHPQPWCLP